MDGRDVRCLVDQWSASEPEQGQSTRKRDWSRSVSVDDGVGAIKDYILLPQTTLGFPKTITPRTQLSDPSSGSEPHSRQGMGETDHGLSSPHLIEGRR